MPKFGIVLTDSPFGLRLMGTNHHRLKEVAICILKA